MDLNTIVDGLQQCLIVATITEPVVEAIKLGIVNKELKAEQKQAISFGVATLVSIGTGTTLFEGNLAQIVVGTVVAGTLAGRGSNVIHSLLAVLKGFSDSVQIKKLK